MRISSRLRVAVAAAAVSAIVPALGASASAPSRIKAAPVKTHPIFLRTVSRSGSWTGTTRRSITPPAPPCPEYGSLPSPLGSCGLPELPATGAPVLGNMAYWGGHVQVHPHIYLVLFGWGYPGAFTSACAPESILEGSIRVTVKCDPDKAGKRMADFIYQMGNTTWANTQTQYYENVGGRTIHIAAEPNYLSGIWADDSGHIDMSTPKSAPDAPYTSMAREAARAAAHFHVTDLTDAQFIIAQPQKFSDPIAAASGYCAFHDYTYPGIEGHIYDGLPKGLVYTNMPYVLNQGAGCGENTVNAGAAGRLDAFTIALGHEIEESVTDPGAEDIIGGVNYGGWYDPLDSDENGDKCAYVGFDPLFGLPGAPALVPGVPGELANIKGNRGGTFPVQSLWSNAAAAGVGYCAGAGNDLPL